MAFGRSLRFINPRYLHLHLYSPSPNKLAFCDYSHYQKLNCHQSPKPLSLCRTLTTMAPNIPEKQWAQVIEKTGGPVEYKQIPGEALFLSTKLQWN